MLFGKAQNFPQQIEFVLWWLVARLCREEKKLWRTPYMCDSRLLILNFTFNKNGLKVAKNATNWNSVYGLDSKTHNETELKI